MGGSGGGGSSGAVSHSIYLEQAHADWINAHDTDLIDQSVTACINNAMGNSPWTSLNAFNPDTDIAAYIAEFTAFKAVLLGLDGPTMFATAYAGSDVVIDPANITAEVTAYSDILDDNIEVNTLPRFRRGMQDINAINSSAYVIGLSVIESFRDRDVAKFTADLMLKRDDKRMDATTMIMQFMAQTISWRADYNRNYADAIRIKLVAKKEQLDQDMAIDEKDALWDLELFQYGANVLAGVQGGTSMTKQKTNPVASALSGAMGGAAAGYMIGTGIGAASSAAASGVAAGAAGGASSGSAAGPWGAAIGAVVGAAVALLSN